MGGGGGLVGLATNEGGGVGRFGRLEPTTGGGCGLGSAGGREEEGEGEGEGVVR